MEEPGKKIIRSFLEKQSMDLKREVVEIFRKEEYEKALDFFYKGNFLSSRVILANLGKNLLSKWENNLNDSERDLLDDLLLIDEADKTKSTDNICRKGMSLLFTDIKRAERICLGLQQIIKNVSREKTNREKEFIENIENVIKEGSTTLQ